jgi:hypothetical protein
MFLYNYIKNTKMENNLRKLIKRFVRLQCPQDIHNENNKNVVCFLSGLSYMTLLPEGLDPNGNEAKLLRRMIRKAWNEEINKSGMIRGFATVPPVIGYTRLNSFGIPQLQYSIYEFLSENGSLELKYDKIYFISIQKERTYGVLYHFNTEQLDFLYVLSMNQLVPIENSEKVHLLKWYYRKEGNKVFENEDLKNTVCLIHGLDLIDNDLKVVNLKTQNLDYTHFETPESYAVYNSFSENIKRFRMERDFFLVSDKNNFFHWFNPATGYLGMKKGAQLSMYVDIDNIHIFEKHEFEEDGKNKFRIVERYDLNKNIQIDNDPKEYVVLLNRIRSILTEKMFNDDYENDPIFEWVKDEPDLTEFEKKDDVVYVNSKSTSIYKSINSLS